MNTIVVDSNNAENTYKAGYKVSWYLYIGFIAIAFIVVKDLFFGIWLLVLNHLRIMHSGLQLPRDMMFEAICSLVVAAIIFPFLIMLAMQLKLARKFAHNGSLLLTPSGIDIGLVDGCKQFISWENVQGVFARTWEKNLSMRIMHTDGEYVIPAGVLLSSDRTLDYIKEHVDLEVKSKGFIWTEYQRRI